MKAVNQINTSLLLMFVFAIISSAIAYTVVVKAYGIVFDLAYYGNE